MGMLEAIKNGATIAEAMVEAEKASACYIALVEKDGRLIIGFYKESDDKWGNIDSIAEYIREDAVLKDVPERVDNVKCYVRESDADWRKHIDWTLSGDAFRRIMWGR